MMKKILFPLTLGCVFVAGFMLGDRSWKRIQLFAPVVINPQALKLEHLSHFLLTEVPPFSSRHYYYCEGYPDTNEFWSFCLPPERVEAFLDTYIERAELSLVEDPSEIPEFVLGMPRQQEWDDRYWFHGFDELDRVYFNRSHFCGYSKNRNRLYLANWDD